MPTRDRREFLTELGSGLGATVLASTSGFAGSAGPSSLPLAPEAVDFRYAPVMQQATLCLPDDPHKSLVGERGDLRYHYPVGSWSVAEFGEVVEFGLGGMQGERVVSQRLEAPAVPIVTTRLERDSAFLELTAFATNRPGEGRVDNVILDIQARAEAPVEALPLVVLRTKREVKVEADGVRVGPEGAAPFLLASAPLRLQDARGWTYLIELPRARVEPGAPRRYLLRFPQEGQGIDRVRTEATDATPLLEEARRFWRDWRAFGAGISWSLPGRSGEFLTACARNILQAREVRDGSLTFQVGATCYRGLWIVDGHFILEAARYLGHAAEAQQGLETTWARQRADGGLFAGGGGEHWKDTGIALFSLVRQAELAQDWAYFRRMQPQVLKAVAFLGELRERARQEGSACGRYGLLARGFGDGGLGGGARDEFTNTIWVLAGLGAVAEAAERQQVSGLAGVRRLHDELRTACFAAMRQEMRRHPAGFDYLPMLMKNDAAWDAPDPWERPQPQVAQWALSHAIYPGLVFSPDDPVVRGHVALMQACTREDVPIETGWIPHEGLWTYNAAFVAHVYLWAGLSDWARRTFTGFLNHASPLYCWREEQPLAGSLVAKYVGDMPHNWASAMCVLYLRHMLALEDGRTLRLLAGVGEPELRAGEPCVLRASPTRFGRISLNLEPQPGGARCRLDFERPAGPAPASVRIPARLGARLRFDEVKGARFTRREDGIEVDPEAPAWTAWWMA